MRGCSSTIRSVSSGHVLAPPAGCVRGRVEGETTPRLQVMSLRISGLHVHELDEWRNTWERNLVLRGGNEEMNEEGGADDLLAQGEVSDTSSVRSRQKAERAERKRGEGGGGEGAMNGTAAETNASSTTATGGKKKKKVSAVCPHACCPMSGADGVPLPGTMAAASSLASPRHTRPGFSLSLSRARVLLLSPSLFLSGSDHSPCLANPLPSPA
eukprot:3746213-Rhodomonas_salina.1